MSKNNMWGNIYASMKKNVYVSDEDIKKISPYMYLRWLGNNQITSSAAAQLNLYHKEIPFENVYKMVKGAFSGKNIYIEMPVLKETFEKNADALAWHFKINKNTVPEYAEFLSKEEINDIQELYDEMLFYENKKG